MTGKQRENLMRKCKDAMARNQNCQWAKNELKYLDVPNLPLPICEMSGAYRSDNEYHGGYTE